MTITANYPHLRLRRNRQSQWIRDLLAQHRVDASDLILPLFVCEGKNQSQKIVNLDEVYRYSIDNLVEKVKEAKALGIKAVMLFAVIDQKLKTADASEAYRENNLVCQAIAEIKAKVSEIGVMADVALDPYTSHGQDGLIDQQSRVLNDETVAVLSKQALTLAKAGVDVVCPSDMMDGRVQAIRKTLDDHGFKDVLICSYSAKYASNFYGPFRYAVDSINNLKNADKKTYQMDFRRSNEALQEIAQDIAEGADLIIIKPALSYIDIIVRAKEKFATPIIGYQVSAEYQMLKLAHHHQILDFNQACLENLIAMKRAGCQAIISYASLEIVKIIKNS